MSGQPKREEEFLPAVDLGFQCDGDGEPERLHETERFTSRANLTGGLDVLTYISLNVMASEISASPSSLRFFLGGPSGVLLSPWGRFQEAPLVSMIGRAIRILRILSPPLGRTTHRLVVEGSDPRFQAAKVAHGFFGW
jgi:hypothetical protein